MEEIDTDDEEDKYCKFYILALKLA